ncbi:MAG: thioredoxin family protein [Acidimicrobiia bacterium]|nr:thioredoxin family protein [Acidimicrobiia bacterium]
MVLTPSTMLDIGTALPPFRLPDTSGREVSDRDFADAKGLLVAFVSVHCPFVKLIQDELGRFGAEYQPKGLAIVAIGSNDLATYPMDGPEGMRRQASACGWTFPCLLDETQEVAKAFRAACTPDFFLFDGDGTLAYRGQFDSSRPGSGIAPTGADLRAAADAVLAGTAVSATQKPSIGCNIKWRAGNEPPWFGA